jgi:hypothetical protein
MSLSAFGRRFLAERVERGKLEMSAKVSQNTGPPSRQPVVRPALPMKLYCFHAVLR